MCALRCSINYKDLSLQSSPSTPVSSSCSMQMYEYHNPIGVLYVQHLPAPCYFFSSIKEPVITRRHNVDLVPPKILQMSKFCSGRLNWSNSWILRVRIWRMTTSIVKHVATKDGLVDQVPGLPRESGNHIAESGGSE